MLSADMETLGKTLSPLKIAVEVLLADIVLWADIEAVGKTLKNVLGPIATTVEVLCMDIEWMGEMTLSSEEESTVS